MRGCPCGGVEASRCGELVGLLVHNCIIAQNTRSNIMIDEVEYGE